MVNVNCAVVGCTSSRYKIKVDYKRLTQENQSDPKKFWKAVKKCLPDKACQQRPQSMQINSTITNDKREVANGFNIFFTKVAVTLRATLPRMSQATLDKTFCNKSRINPRGKKFLFRPVTKGEVLKVISSLKQWKYPGLDSIPQGTVKDAALVITQPLLHILNLSLSTSKVPLEWKVARCVPVFKGGDAKNLDNYRPISVLPVFSKILERVVHYQLYEYLESNKLLAPYQFGFRKNRSTSSAVVHLTDTIRKNMDMGELTGALFIDLQKAFDTVDHQSLTSKLLCYVVENAEFKWVKDYLSNRSQVVNYEGEKSREENILFGVPQGLILGPLLFLVHVNDFHQHIEMSKLLMYADDTVLLFSDRNEAEIEKAINHDAKILHNWLCSSGLILNPKQGKREFMTFGTAAKRSKITHRAK